MSRTRKSSGLYYLILIIIIVLVLLFNSGGRNIVKRKLEINRLTKQIEVLKYENELLTKRLYYLENDPVYLEKMVRKELGVISEDEYEYKFDVKKEEEGQ